MMKRINTYLSAHPKQRQWLWFVALWLFGLGCVTVLTYPLKLIIRHLS
jgi:hypothetical protein